MSDVSDDYRRRVDALVEALETDDTHTYIDCDVFDSCYTYTIANSVIERGSKRQRVYATPKGSQSFLYFTTMKQLKSYVPEWGPAYPGDDVDKDWGRDTSSRWPFRVVP